MFILNVQLALDGQIQMRNNGYIDNELATKAGNLIIYFDAHFTELYSVESINRLRDIAFVPVVQPLSSASIIKNNNGRLKEKSETNNDKNNDPTAAANAQRKVMVTFSACLLYGDRHLGWTHANITRTISNTTFGFEKNWFENTTTTSCYHGTFTRNMQRYRQWYISHGIP